MNITTCNSNSNDPINIYSHLEQCHPACHPSILDPTTVLDDIQSNTSFPRQGTARGTNYAHVSRCNKSCAEPSTHHRDFFSARPRPRDDRSNEPQGARQLTSLYKSARSSPAKVSPTDTTAPPINRTRTQHRAKLPFPFARISSRAQGVFLIFFFFDEYPFDEGKNIVCNDTILDDDISSFAPTFSNLLFFSEIESCRPEMKKIRNIFLLLSLVAPTVRTRKCKTLVCISLPSPRIVTPVHTDSNYYLRSSWSDV